MDEVNDNSPKIADVNMFLRSFFFDEEASEGSEESDKGSQTDDSSSEYGECKEDSSEDSDEQMYDQLKNRHIQGKSSAR